MSQVKITCPVDGGTNCFHERLKEGDTYMSFDCGFASNEHYKIGSQAIANVLEKAPQLVKDLAFEDEALSPSPYLQFECPISIVLLWAKPTLNLQYDMVINPDPFFISSKPSVDSSKVHL